MASSFNFSNVLAKSKFVTRVRNVQMQHAYSFRFSHFWRNRTLGNACNIDVCENQFRHKRTALTAVPFHFICSVFLAESKNACTAHKITLHAFQFFIFLAKSKFEKRVRNVKIKNVYLHRFSCFLRNRILGNACNIDV